MTFTAALTADLALLTDALGDPDAHPPPNLAETVEQLAANARATVTSYLGLSIVVAAHEPTFRFTVLDDGVDPDDVLTSLKLPLPEPGTGGSSIAVILYAANPGAFVDLAADLGFLTGRPLATIDIDQHLSLAADPDTTLPRPPRRSRCSTQAPMLTRWPPHNTAETPTQQAIHIKGHELRLQY